MCKVYNIRVPIFVYSYSEIYKGKHYFSLALILLPKTHGNLHDVIEFLIANSDLFKIVALATIALLRHLFAGVIQIAFVANIIHDIASLLPVDVVYI